MTQPICPYVAAFDADDKRSAPVTYPSFENHCAVVHLIDPADDGLDSGEQLLLRDQATYCLGSGHRLCPRFRLIQAQGGGPAETDPQSVLPFGMDDDFAITPEEGRPGRLGLWAGVTTLLLVFLLCGGSLAAYTGWRLVGRGLASLNQPANSQPETGGPGPIILLVTATSPPQAESDSGVALVVTAPPTPTPTYAFPQAVTATPGAPAQTGPIVITTPTPIVQTDDPLAPELATAVAGALVITQPGDTPPTPTRRPTPIFVVPTSTPGAPLAVDPATSATPVSTVLPTVNFRAANDSILPGACTILYWDVENARAVFLDGAGVAGHGERQVCQRWTSQTYVLDVLRLDGNQETHKVIVQLVPHTLTPTITPTRTPVLTPTPTWTPEGTPSATPIPPSYGVRVTVDGGNQKQCTSGQTCQISLLIENSGSLADEMFVNLGKNGPWTAALCRDDDVCGDTSLSVGVGAGQARGLLLRVDVPAGSGGQSYTYVVEATSGNSGRTVTSGQVTVTLHGQ